MSITRTLGGERLGSGKNMKVHMHGYERSTFDMGYIFRTTMSPGTLVPFIKELALPGDTFDIDLQAYVNTLPTIGPLFGSFKMQMDVFQAPIRLYQGQLHNNKLNIGMKMSDVKLPRMSQVSTPLPSLVQLGEQILDVDNYQINPSCILAYLGIRGIGFHTDSTEVIRSMNAVPFLAYWDIYKQYYSNKMEEIGAVIHRPQATVNFTITTFVAHGAGSTTSVDQYPVTTNQAYIEVGGYVDITYTGTDFNPDYVMVWTTVGPGMTPRKLVPLSQVYGNFQRVSGTVHRALDPLFNVMTPPYIIYSWDYINPTDVPQDGEPLVHTFPLENIDTMREAIMSWTDQGVVPFNVNNQDLEPYNLVLNRVGTAPDYYYSRLSPQEGLAVKTYQSDLFNNWLNTEFITGANGIDEVTAIDTSGGNFHINTLILAKKVYNMLNRIAVSGGTYDDWLDTVYDHERFTRAESPIYHGGLIKEVVFQEVISTGEGSINNSINSGSPLGTLAGKGTLDRKHKGGKIRIKVDEPSYIIGLVSLTPRIDYSQGNKWDIGLETMDDFHKPALDEIGFQDLITDQMAWWSAFYTGGLRETWSAGKQPAWINYMTNVNVVRGNFAIQNNQMFMVLNRKYEFTLTAPNNFMNDLTTYIDPAKFNHIFAQTSRDAMNFWVQIGIDMTVRRKMSSKLMPNL